MNRLQELAVKVCLEGHNLCLTGQAGTGKTFTVEKIKDALQKTGKSVAITCTTGMACLQYNNAKTIHSWAGLQDGRFSKAGLVHLIKNDEKFQLCKDNVLKTDTVIIDEISMFSKALFEQLEEVFRSVREINLPFGGVQMVVVGDFYQLPPVPSVYGDPGQVCITSNIWKNTMHHHINLEQVHRQHQMELIHAVSELARGKPSEATNKLMKGLSRALPANKENIVRLCAKNITVNFLNDQMLDDFNGEVHVFEAIDFGEERHLRKVRAQKSLALKIGCPVVLISNLSGKLVNGLHGVVVKIGDTGPTVNFKSVGITKKLDRFQFALYSKERRANIATRRQFPLRLSYAITIHKAQGMTLDAVVVDCKDAFKPGQISVAVGRAKTIEGLQVVNYHPSLATKPDIVIQQFYENDSINEFPASPPSTCCKCALHVPLSTEIILDVMSGSEPDSDASELNYDELQETDRIFTSLDAEVRNVTEIYKTDEPQPSISTTGTSSSASPSSPTSIKITYPASFQPVTIARSLQYDNPITEEQKKLNRVITLALKQEIKFQEYSHVLWTELCDMFNKCTSTARKETVSTKELNKFNSDVYQLIYSLKDSTTVKDLFPTYSFDEQTFCSKFTLKAAKSVLTWKASLVQKSVPAAVTSTCKTMSVDGTGKVRYVGGMCVAKLKFKLMKIYHNNIHSKLKKKKELADKSRQQVQMLQSMEESYAELTCKSKYSQSLVQTQRRQNERCSLTNISDSAFEFFMQLEMERSSRSRKELVHKHKHDVLSVITEQVIAVQDIKRKFLESVCMCEGVSGEIKQQLYTALVQKYMGVGNNAFRKDLMALFSKKKKFAHRTQISSQTHQKGIHVPVSKEPEAGSSTSEEIVTKTKGSAASISEAVPQKRKGKGKGKGKTSKKQKVSGELFFCPNCGKLYEEDQEWIECAKCRDWYDRQCCKIEDQEWDKFVTSDIEWLCPNCSEKHS